MGYSAAVDSFAGEILCAGKALVPERFRFIVCSDFLDQQRLSVVEYEALPQGQYAAVSYPWNGLKSSDPPNSFFRLPLEGHEQLSDPISLAVLRTACLAARQSDADLLWIDQICIMQTSAQDKDWQISRMFDLYDSCKVCLVLPGGLQRLAAHDESTNWIERSWTLQEAMPKSTHAVFAWRFGGGDSRGLTSGRVVEVEKGRSAMMELGKLLQACFIGGLALNEHSTLLKLFGTNKDPILALMAVKEARGPEMRDMAVWRSALLRTCSQPRDMILSIMGIFGVKLDVGRYGKDDREKAVVDLAFEVLRNGRGPSWLGAAPGCANLLSMSSMPAFPAMDGREVYYTVAGRKERPWKIMGSNMTWYVKPVAKAKMETRGSGRLHLTAKSLPIELRGLGPKKEKPFWPGFDFTASLCFADGHESGRSVAIDLSASVDAGGCIRALVVGLVEHFNLPATAARMLPGAALLMVLKWNSSMDGWENVAYGTITDVEDVTRTWPTFVHAVGC